MFMFYVPAIKYNLDQNFILCNDSSTFLQPAIRNRRFLRPLLHSLLLSTTTGRITPQRISTVHLDPSHDPSVVRSNLRITSLLRDGDISSALHLFDRTSQRDLITWTSVISGLVRCGRLHDAHSLFSRPDAKRNVVTWTALLSGYVRAGHVERAKQLFSQMPDKNVISYNTMLAGYTKYKHLVDYGRKLFDEMPIRNVVSWNTMLTGYIQSGRVDDALELFREMPERDVISWTAMVAGLAQNGRVNEARELFDQIPERNVVSWNAMVSGYAQNGRVEEALVVFKRMPERDVASWNTIITGLVQNGRLKEARETFDGMGGRDRNVVTWTTLISGYVQDGQNEAALKLFLRMMVDGVRPNEGTFVSVLAAASSLAALQEGKQIHQVVSKTVFQFNTFVDSALINMYSKCGEIRLAEKLFALSDHKDSVSWNGMVAAYAHHGLGKEALRLFEEMKRNGFRPDDVSYVAVLSACSHAGLVDEGLRLFRELVRDGSIRVREDHHACLVDLCGRAGRFEDARKLLDDLKIKPSSSCVWGALLGGCNNHGNVEIGKVAAKKLLEADPNNTGTYMLLSNIYASAGRWKEAKKVRMEMKDRGLKKQPGCSWIEIGSRVHVFLVRDTSHRESGMIYTLLQDLHYEMKFEGLMTEIDGHRLNVDAFMLL